MYKLYTDKSETFECKINLQGASTKNAIARIIVESKDWHLIFEGTIDSNGKCKIPIKKLNILDENTTGTIKLEVISEDVYFQPWKSDFKIEVNKKAIVEVISQSDTKSSNKAKITISEVNNSKVISESTILEFIKELDNNKITLKTFINYKPNKQKIDMTIGKFIHKHKLTEGHKSILMKQLIKHFFFNQK